MAVNVLVKDIKCYRSVDFIHQLLARAVLSFIFFPYGFSIVVRDFFQIKAEILPLVDLAKLLKDLVEKGFKGGRFEAGFVKYVPNVHFEGWLVLVVLESGPA